MEAVACHDFEPKDLNADPPELAFKKGDKLLLLNLGDPVHWYTAQKDHQTGLVPENYIEIKWPNWYLGRIPRAYAEQMLQRYDDGSFLIRLSESSPSDFSLSVKCADAVQHFRILRTKDTFEYFLWNTTFKSLNELVEHYKHESVSRTNQIYLREMDIFIVEAMYDFEPNDSGEEGETELGFRKGDLIQVFDTRDEHWWGGQMGDRTGFFPKSYVKKRNE